MHFITNIAWWDFRKKYIEKIFFQTLTQRYLHNAEKDIPVRKDGINNVKAQSVPFGTVRSHPFHWTLYYFL